MCVLETQLCVTFIMHQYKRSSKVSLCQRETSLQRRDTLSHMLLHPFSDVGTWPESPTNTRALFLHFSSEIPLRIITQKNPAVHTVLCVSSNTVPVMKKLSHLGTSIPLNSLIGPQWMNCYSSTSFSFFSPPFPSSSSLFLSPHPPLTLFSATLEERKEVRGWVCEPSFSFCPFLSLSPLVFLLFLFLLSQRGEPGAP